MKKIKAWAVIGPTGELYNGSIRGTRRKIIDYMEAFTGQSWLCYQDKYGYRIRRITIIVED